MKRIIAIAKNTFKETIRDKVLFGLLGFAIIYILIDIFFAKLSLGDLVMIRSFGLAGVYVFGLVITIFLGASIIHKEVERRTLYFVLSKPVSVREMILGKFLGLFFAVILTTGLMALVYVGVVASQGGGLDYVGLMAIGYQILEMGLFIAILTFFSTIAAPLTSTVCAAMLLFSGHLLPTVLKNTEKMGALTHGVTKTIYYVLPNFDKFNIRNSVVHSILPTTEMTIWALIYAMSYGALLLILAVVLFRKKDL